MLSSLLASAAAVPLTPSLSLSSCALHALPTRTGLLVWAEVLAVHVALTLSFLPVVALLYALPKGAPRLLGGCAACAWVAYEPFLVMQLLAERALEVRSSIHRHPGSRPRPLRREHAHPTLGRR